VGEGSVVNVQCCYRYRVCETPIVTLLKKFAQSWKVWVTVATAFAAADSEHVDAKLVRRYGTIRSKYYFNFVVNRTRSGEPF